MLDSTFVSPLSFHPARLSLFNELHARPFPVLPSSVQLIQLLLLPQSIEAERAHLTALCQRHALLAPGNEASCYYQDFGGFELRWERHTEFSTYTLICPGNIEQPFAHNPLSLLPPDWLAALPGQVLSSTQLNVLPAPEQEVQPDDLRSAFEGQRLISTWLGEGHARLWTAYRIHSDGSGRLLLHNHSLNPCQTGRLVRSLLELEAYRMMLLLTLPLAKDSAPKVRAMDQQLTQAIHQINDSSQLHSERELLNQLSGLAASVEQLIADLDYRFSAARAYYELIGARLDELREQECEGLQGLRDFLERRLTPAWRTCEAAERGLADLGRRIERASQLLRTRIDLAIETQNQQLLQAMNRRGHAQLRLQQTVEGLSVAAISYYLVGLCKYLAESAHSAGLISKPALWIGLAVPLCFTGVWWATRRLKRSLHLEPKEALRSRD